VSSFDLRIRAAAADDLAAIVAFNIALARESEDITLDPTTVYDGVWAGLADPGRGLYFLAEENGRVIGQTMVTLEWSDWRNGFFWWIQSVYVEPACRRRGVFRRLYQHIRALARERDDVCGLRLYVYDKNVNAIKTYRILGMKQTDYLLCEEDWSRP